MSQQVHASLSEHFPGSDKHEPCGYKQVPSCRNAGVGTGHGTGGGELAICRNPRLLQFYCRSPQITDACETNGFSKCRYVLCSGVWD